MRDPPPLHQEWGFETPSNDKKILYNKQNKGRVIGRAYLIRADAPSINNELKSLKLVYTSVAISALLTGLLILLYIEFSYYLIKEAQIQAENALRLARKASDIAIEEKKQAEKAARLAQEASNRANHEKEQAEEAARLAQEASNRANHEKEQAEASVRNIQTQSSQERQELEEAVHVAQEASNRANHEKEQAEESARLATENSDRANQGREQAEESARLATENSDRANQGREQAEESARLAREERDSASTDNKTLLNEIEIEVNKRTNSLTERITELDNQNNQIPRAASSNYRNNDIDGDRRFIIIESGEEDFYNGERKDIIIDALTMYMNNVHEDSRRKHIVKDIVDLNSYHGDAKKIKKNILRTLIDDKSNCQDRLSALGFEIISENNHLKLHWQGDPRYPIILSKTSSDINVAKKATRTIANKIL